MLRLPPTRVGRDELTPRVRWVELCAAALGVAWALVLMARAGADSRPGIAGAEPDVALGPIPSSATQPFRGQLLVYGSDPFTRAQVRAVTAAVGQVAAVYSRQLNIKSGRAGYPDIPVSAITVDPAAYSQAAGRPELAAALRRGAVLSATEAVLRHASTGSRLTFSDGRSVVVSAVVDDHVLGGQELAVPESFRAVPTLSANYLVVAAGADVKATARAVRAALPHLALRTTTATSNGFFSSADSVLTQLQVKARFGEFAMRRTGGNALEQDPAWVQRNLVTRHVPQLGTVTCHRAVLPALVAAMQDVTDRGLGGTVHTADFQYEGGCWNPNIVPGAAGTISRHTWGLAVDINVDTNPFGASPRQNARLVAILRRHGFTWGGTWLRPDAMHFEYTGG